MVRVVVMVVICVVPVVVIAVVSMVLVAWNSVVGVSGHCCDDCGCSVVVVMSVVVTLSLSENLLHLGSTTLRPHYPLYLFYPVTPSWCMSPSSFSTYLICGHRGRGMV